MKKLFYIFFILLTLQCRERFEIPFDSPDTGFLVVEGIIKYGGETNIHLSRSSKFREKNTVYERSAFLQVEGEDNTIYPLVEKDSGSYASTIVLNAAIKYRLRIRTANNKEYLSDFRPVIITPEIDSIQWVRNNGVQIYLYSHDPENDTRYYKWNYQEDWDYHSEYRTNVYFTYTLLPNGQKYYNGIEYFYPVSKATNDSLYYCWGRRFSSKVMIGSTVKLSDDVVYMMPIQYYPENSWELNHLYAIKVTQTGLSKEGYEFYERMKKNTESLGSVFDSQPSELTGNILCTTDPAEMVIGFMEAASETEKRIFISIEELPGWRYKQKCRMPEPGMGVGGNNPYDILWKAVVEGFAPVGVSTPDQNSGYPITGFQALDRICVDCRLRGSSVKPEFWP